jgi:predicted kinase
MNNVVLVGGYVAAGKSSVRKALRESFNIRVVSTDDLRKELFPLELDYRAINLKNPKDAARKIKSWIKVNDPKKIDFQQVLNPLVGLDDSLYVEILQKYAPKIKEQKTEVYDKAFADFDRMLADGRNVIFDATFSKRSMRERAYQIISKNGIKNVYIVQVICDEDIVRFRLENRKTGNQITNSNAKQLEIFRIVKKEFDESEIQKDSPKGLKVSRIVYDTGNKKVELFGESDETVLRILKKLEDLSRKYKSG